MSLCALQIFLFFSNLSCFVPCFIVMKVNNDRTFFKLRLYGIEIETHLSGLRMISETFFSG